MALPESGSVLVSTPASQITETSAMASLHVVLVEPEIHWNTGNVGRTCLAVGAQLHLVEPLGFSLDERQVRRAGLDYWARVAPRVWPSWQAFEAELPALGAPTFFTAAAPRAHWEVSYPRPCVLVFGRESVGLPPELLARHARDCARIPMLPDTVRSLNLSTAAAIGVYEVVRQWGAWAR
jgi:tRNA (cytidine/uridine-2'-O-)-methyltransferase